MGKSQHARAFDGKVTSNARGVPNLTNANPLASPDTPDSDSAPPTGKTKRQSPSREALVEAARELIWERGYTATSPRAILDASNVGSGSMYHFFSGKEALAHAAISRNHEETRRQITSALESHSGAVGKVKALLSAEGDVLKGSRFGRLVQEADIVAAPLLHAEIGSMFDWMLERMVDALIDGIRSGEFRGDIDAKSGALAVMAAAQGAYLLAAAARDPDVFDNAIGGILGLISERVPEFP